MSNFSEVIFYIENCFDAAELDILARAIAIQRSTIAVAVLDAFEAALILEPDSNIE